MKVVVNEINKIELGEYIKDGLEISPCWGKYEVVYYRPFRLNSKRNYISKDNSLIIEKENEQTKLF